MADETSTAGAPLDLGAGLHDYVRSIRTRMDAQSITPHDGQTGARASGGRWAVTTTPAPDEAGRTEADRLDELTQAIRALHVKDDPERFITTQELAEMLRTGPETVRYWRHVGKGPKSFKLGRRVLYAIEDVEAYIAEARS